MRTWRFLLEASVVVGLAAAVVAVLALQRAPEGRVTGMVLYDQDCLWIPGTASPSPCGCPTSNPYDLCSSVVPTPGAGLSIDEPFCLPAQTEQCETYSTEDCGIIMLCNYLRCDYTEQPVPEWARCEDTGKGKCYRKWGQCANPHYP